MVGIEPDRLLEQLHGALRLADIGQAVAHLGQQVGIVGIELQGALVGGDRLVVLLLVEVGETHLRIAACVEVVILHGKLGEVERFVQRRLRIVGPAIAPLDVECARDRGIAAAVARIKRTGLLVKPPRMGVAFGPEAEAEVLAPQDQPVGVKIRMVLLGQAAPLRQVDMHCEPRCGGGGDGILEGEDIGDRAVIALRPDRVFRLRVDEIDGDPNAVAGAAEAAGQKVANAEPVADLAHRARTGGDEERRVPRDDHQVAEAA